MKTNIILIATTSIIAGVGMFAQGQLAPVINCTRAVKACKTKDCTKANGVYSMCKGTGRKTTAGSGREALPSSGECGADWSGGLTCPKNSHVGCGGGNIDDWCIKKSGTGE